MDTRLLIEATKITDGKNNHTMAQLVNAYMMNVSAAKTCSGMAQNEFKSQAAMLETKIRKLIAAGRLAKL
jgi:hypothetical protein